MCGFIGYILNQEIKKEKEIENKFNIYFNELKNRGPDYSESKKIKHKDKIINVGFARLAIETQTPIILAMCPKADDIYDVYSNSLTAWAYQKYRIPVFFARGQQF